MKGLVYDTRLKVAISKHIDAFSGVSPSFPSPNDIMTFSGISRVPTLLSSLTTRPTWFMVETASASSQPVG
jgi:hypothetical protein